MILQDDVSGIVWLIIGILIASLLLWLSIYLGTNWVVNKQFAKDKKVTLLIAAVILVLLTPLIASLASSVLGVVGGGIVSARQWINSLTPWNEINPTNQLIQLVAIIQFLIFILLLKLIVGMDWKDTTFVALIGLLILYVFYSFFPEVYYMYPW